MDQGPFRSYSEKFPQFSLTLARSDPDRGGLENHPLFVHAHLHLKEVSSYVFFKISFDSLVAHFRLSAREHDGTLKFIGAHSCRKLPKNQLIAILLC
jgi:hypothetical protein